jgi:hypothetical protein
MLRGRDRQPISANIYRELSQLPATSIVGNWLWRCQSRFPVTDGMSSSGAIGLNLTISLVPGARFVVSRR